MSRGDRFRRYSWILLLIAAFMVFYSGLFLLDLAPGRPDDSFRFWNGGEEALFWGGVFDIAGGLPALLLISIKLIQGTFKKEAGVKGWFAALLLFYALGIAGDLAAGLYTIGAQTGFYTTLACQSP